MPLSRIPGGRLPRRHAGALFFTFATLAASPCAHAEEASEAQKRVLRMDELVVTAGRIEQRLGDVPLNATVLSRYDIESSAPLTVDDLLRQVPGFSLFRRSSSLVANPTTQGVTLRGIAPSGVSRTLVLLDGIPLNDPFGGWVYWSRIPRDSIERIEIVRGGGSSVWGNYALGGVINVLTERPKETRLRFRGEGGNHATYSIGSSVAGVRGPVGVDLGVDAFGTAGYEVVREDQRGAIDEDADSEHQSFRGRVEYAASPGVTTFVAGQYFAENRNNGTPLTENRTHTGAISGGGTLDTEDGSRWQVTAFSQLQGFENSFSSQAPDRSSELPAADQFDVPSTAGGASLQWTRRAFGEHVLSAGPDFRWVDGETHEDFRFMEGVFTRRRDAGGEQQIAGFFGQDVFPLIAGIEATAGARVDVWRSLDLFRRERDLQTGAPVLDGRFGDRTRTAVSPKVGLRYPLAGGVSLRGAYYQAFRAPTLNELIRPFRVRNDLTEANTDLDPERLIGGEAGADWTHGMALARLTGFWNEVADPIANVTIGAAPAGGGVVAPCGFLPEGGLCRQRQNLGRSRIRGIEAEVDVSPFDSLLASVGYFFSDAVLTDAPAELEGKRIAQVPKHQLALRFVYEDPRIATVSLQTRYLSRQFEDDLNSLSLGDYAVVDLFLGREIRSGVELFFAIENLFDRTYQAGKSGDGIVTIGAPLLAHGGVRIHL